MSVKLKPLHRQIIVITGASSGIGLVTACQAAKDGARVVLVSRNEEALQQVVREITEQGGEAIHIVADVASREDLQRVADETVARLGRFDTWVNNAGVSIWGRLEEVSDEDHRRLFDTNFWGLVYGSLIATKYLKANGGGAIVNVGSVASDMALPLQGMYSATKHAVKGFTDALRIELKEEGAPISVTLIKPSAIDTPFPHHAKNYTDREPKLPAPVYPPEEVAHAILYAAVHGGRDIFVGGSGKLMSLVNKNMPRLMDWGAAQSAGQQLSQEAPRQPDGALHHAGADGRVRGGHPGYVMGSSAYTRASLRPVLTGAMLGVLGAAFLTLTKGARGGDFDLLSRARGRMW
jgi:short-subunit dehydrogenase